MQGFLFSGECFNTSLRETTLFMEKAGFYFGKHGGIIVSKESLLKWICSFLLIKASSMVKK